MSHRDQRDPRDPRDHSRDPYPPQPPQSQQQQSQQQQQQQQQQGPPGAPPHHSSAGSIPIHQPVASRISGAIHSPNGLLANHGAGAGGAPPPQMGGPPPQQGPPSGYGGPPPAMHNGPSDPSRQHPMQEQPQQPMYSMMQQHNGSSGPPNGSSHPANYGIPSEIRTGHQPGPNYGGSPMGPAHSGHAHSGHIGVQDQQSQAHAGQRPAGQGPAGQGPAAGGGSQGQQPILNDALSYLDQVKVQFHEMPDVYNRFLDIMKDFKSQTIDTPGVISRVSDLFAGHPNLIQGFNTFLPPGYRIECGLENNPNSIRVTTPSGSTIHSIGASRSVPQDGLHAASGPGGAMHMNPRSWPHQQQPQQQQQHVQHSVEGPDAPYGGPAQQFSQGPGGPFGHGGAGSSMFDGPRGHQGSLHGGPGGGPPGQAAQQTPVPRNTHTPAPNAGSNGTAAQQGSGEKRGPVEFNHAISYVNKIKNRFQDKPEIYKQFLEILQTYQREQKPIQEVYGQVTTLFSGAPDLLEDFKQFLPETAAHPRPAGGRPSEDASAPLASVQTTPPSQTSRDGPKMPPVGNFAPPSSTTKENKKRPRQDKQTPAPVPPPVELAAATSSIRGPPTAAAVTNKRTKLTHRGADIGAALVEPTLTPVMPGPMPPTYASQDFQDSLAFFERVKKMLPNRTAMTEFLKLINMYRLGLIERNVLVSRAHGFIGSNSEIFNWFKSFIGYDGEDEVIDNQPQPPSGKVSLSNCRGFGPSYRLLPRRERLKRCSGRDELCNSVLNDAWASHPTWASEDSGFVAHRKNGYEEGLHRIEEERHDYDFYIEANQKFIQLLEPLAQQMLTLAPSERENFRMPPGLGGQSTSIYKRVLKKVYGPEKGVEVAADMFSHPFAAVPIIMTRLKQKDEEWRFSQREWEKVWMAQTEAMHLKSLDHMGIQVKSNDKRNLSAKHLVDNIKTKREEQRRGVAAIDAKSIPSVHQFLWEFSDREVLVDLLRFMVLYVLQSGQHGANEKERITEFFETFIPQFFDIPEEVVSKRLSDIDRDSGSDEGDDAAPTELTNGRSSRRNAKKSDLLRGVLDPGRNGAKSSSASRNHKEDSAGSGSKETTPDVSANEEEMPDAPGAQGTPAPAASALELGNERWLPAAPGATVVKGNEPLTDADAKELKADGPFKRQWYNLFCNQTLFVFFSVFHTLYKRLKDVKESTDSVVEELEREDAEKASRHLGMAANRMDYFKNLQPHQFWPKTVELIEDYIVGETDENRYFDVLRHYYLKKGWTLYTIQDLLKTLCRQALVCSTGSDNSRDKTADLVQQFMSNRKQEETSFAAEISARKFAEKCIKDGEMFQITWYPRKNEVAVRWLQRDEPTFNADAMARQEKWQYYISSYMRVEPTEGVNTTRLRKPVLSRSLVFEDGSHGGTADSDSHGEGRKAAAFSEDLDLRICLNSSAIVYGPNTSEYFLYNHDRVADDEDDEDAEQDGDADAEGDSATADERKQKKLAARAARRAEQYRVRKSEKEAQTTRRQARREQRFREKFVINNAWMKNKTQEEVRTQTAKFAQWVKDGLLPGGEGAAEDAGSGAAATNGDKKAADSGEMDTAA